MSLSRLALLPLLTALLVGFAPGPPQIPPQQQPSLVEIAAVVNAESGEFATLIAAVSAAGLLEVLDGKQHLTVFAPTDAAFAELGYTPDNIGDLPPDALLNILLYHVTKGDRFSNSVINAPTLKMLNGDKTSVSVTMDGVFVDQSRLLTPDLIDLDARNGVIHVIDAVLLPPEA
jgi:uncharacterized surface protein with fasciclin (FAS1) repeats